MENPETAYLATGNAIPDAVPSQMFGKRCFKIGNKAFVAFFQDCMVFKLTGNDHAQAMSLNSAILFDPSGKGRAMKEWVQVPYEHVAQLQGFALAAKNYVAS